MMQRQATWYKFNAAQFSKDVKAFRQGRGLSVRDMAKSFGISASTVSRIENARHEPSLGVATMICIAMDRQPDEYIVISNEWRVYVQEGLL